jgi:hypothetical protein
MLLSLVPLSCSEESLELHQIGRFVGNGGSTIEGSSDNTGAFLVKGDRLQIASHFGLSSLASGHGISRGSFSIEVYDYPDGELVKTVIDKAEVQSEYTYRAVEVQVDEGLYYLRVFSSAYVSWTVIIVEWV